MLLLTPSSIPSHGEYPILATLLEERSKPLNLQKPVLRRQYSGTVVDYSEGQVFVEFDQQYLHVLLLEDLVERFS